MKLENYKQSVWLSKASKIINALQVFERVGLIIYYDYDVHYSYSYFSFHLKAEGGLFFETSSSVDDTREVFDKKMEEIERYIQRVKDQSSSLIEEKRRLFKNDIEELERDIKAIEEL